MAIATVAVLGAATAAAAPALPQNVGPGQVKRQIESIPSPQPPPRTVPFPESAKTRVTMPEQRFVLSGVLVEGATTFGNITFLPFYQTYLGTKTTVTDLRKIADAITRHYHQAGYFLSYTFLPAQRIEFGIVRIRVIEGYISKWTVTGDATAHDPLFEKILRPVLAQRPLRRTTLDDAFQKLAALPDIIFHPYLRAVPNHLGAYELVLNTQQKHVGGGVSIDNHGVDYLGSVQGMLALQAFNLTGHHESYQFRFATTDHPDELKYFDLATEWLLGEDGARLQVSADHTRANPGARLKPLDAHIENNHVRVGALYPMQLAADRSTYLGVAANVYRSSTDLVGANRIENRLTTAVLSFRHIAQQGARATQSLALSLTKGLKIAGSKVVDTLNGTEAGSPAFFKLNLSYAYLRLIRHRVALSAQLGGQYATGALPALERYSIGGERFGRAYDPSEIVGDSGLAGRLQISLRQAVTADHWSATPYGFYGLGRVWQASRETSYGGASLASCGLGVRAGRGAFSGYVEVAKPLTRRIASEGNKEARVFGGMEYQF